MIERVFVCAECVFSLAGCLTFVLKQAAGQPHRSILLHVFGLSSAIADTAESIKMLFLHH